MNREEAIARIREHKIIHKMNEPRAIYISEALDMGIKALENQKTGHWILTDVEWNRVWKCNCSECGKDPQDYIGGSENWWLIKNELPKYCPNCGAKMEGE